MAQAEQLSAEQIDAIVRKYVECNPPDTRGHYFGQVFEGPPYLVIIFALIVVAMSVVF